MTQTRNDILIDGEAFPGEDMFSTDGSELILLEQSAATCLLYNGVYAGFFIIHPNNIGRCAHTVNASYCIDKRMREKGLFKHLVKRALWDAKQLVFQGMQFNAVVANNKAAIHTYLIVSSTEITLKLIGGTSSHGGEQIKFFAFFYWRHSSFYFI